MCAIMGHWRCQHANAYMYVSMRALTGAIHKLVSETKSNMKLCIKNLFFFFWTMCFLRTLIIGCVLI